MRNYLKKKCNQFAEEQIQCLLDQGLLEITPALLNCDLFYQTSGVEINTYRANYDSYQKCSEYIRAELLDEGIISDEVISVVWLLKQSGDLLALFSREEGNQIHLSINTLYREYDYSKDLFSIILEGNKTRLWKNVLDKKKDIALSQFGVGLVFTFPLIEKTEAVFIETEKFFANKEDRLIDTLKRLEGNGHICIVKSKGVISLVEIDNILYELISDGIMLKPSVIYGVRLRRYIL